MNRIFTSCLVLLLAVSGAWTAAAETKPNIIFIIVDDMGYADLGCYGGTAIDTPNIDRLAAEGMRFTDAYSGCVVCAPARSTLLTGTHMGNTSVRGNTGGISLAPEDITIGQVMKQAGYATGGFGKWGVGDLDTDGVPEKKGFDTFYGYYHQIHAHSYYPDYLIRNGEKEYLEGNERKRGKHYTHYLIFDEMRKFIRDHADQPFFCYAPWTPPHGDYVIPRDDPGWIKYKDKDWPRDARVIAAMDDMIDRHVGETLDLLEELGIDDNTLVFFCSDNGAAKRLDGILDSSGPLRGEKRTIYEGGIRVPMIARWPGRIKPNQVSDVPWYFPDVLPTIADAAGAQVPEGIDGISILPTLLGETGQADRDMLYWEYPMYNWSQRAYVEHGLMQAVRSGEWKILRHRSDQPWELYNLEKDLGEQHDVAAEHEDIVRRLSDWAAKNRTEPRPQIEPEMPEGQRYR